MSNRGQDARLRNALRRFMETQDPADAAAFATEFIRANGPPAEAEVTGRDLIRDEYEVELRDLAKRVVGRLDIEDDMVSRDAVDEGIHEQVRDHLWTRDTRALQTLLVSQNAFYGVSEGLLHLSLPDGPAGQVHYGTFRRTVQVTPEQLTDEDGLIPQLAAWALTADLRDEVTRLLEERGVTTD